MLSNRTRLTFFDVNVGPDVLALSDHSCTTSKETELDHLWDLLRAGILQTSVDQGPRCYSIDSAWEDNVRFDVTFPGTLSADE